MRRQHKFPPHKCCREIMSRNYYDNKIIFRIEATTIIILNETTTQISAMWWVSLSLLTEYNATNYVRRVSNAEKKRGGNYVNPNRDRCGNVIVPRRGRYYYRHYNHIPSSQLRQETFSACNYSLLVVASRKAPFT